MLNKLSTAKFELIDPPSEWTDIGYTEREIWVNSKGYGYIACDEPTRVWIGQGISIEELKVIKDKLLKGTLLYCDIENSTFEDFIEEIFDGEDYKDDEWLNGVLEEILMLEDNDIEILYGLETFEGWLFFSSKDEFEAVQERDWCDYEWKDLDDDSLKIWINRLFGKQ